MSKLSYFSLIIAGLVAFSLPATSSGLGSWVSTKTVSSSNFNNMSAVGIDKSGNAVVVWGETRSCDGFPCDGIWARSHSAAGIWGPAQLISDPNLTDPSDTPAVYISDSGFATAIWNDSKGVESSDRPLGGHWTAPVVISAGGRAYASAGDHAGDVAVLIDWRTILLRRADGPWSNTGFAIPASYPFVAAHVMTVVSPSGDVVLLWYSYQEHCIGHFCTPFNFQPHVSRLTPGSSRWNVSNPLPGIDQNQHDYWLSSLIALDDSGAAGVVAATAKGTVLVSQTGFGQRWSAPYLLPTSGSVVGFASDAAGGATAIATEGSGAKIVALTGLLTGDVWTRQAILSVSANPLSVPLLAVSPSGSAAVLWQDATHRANSRFTVAASTRPSPDAGWTGQQDLAPSNQDEKAPEGLAAAGFDRAIAAWTDDTVNGPVLTAGVHQP